ncbi:MAG: polysaccharide deacetylase family protein [Bacillota bacterium]
MSVKEAQSILKSLGLYAGALDGILGPQTRAALREFQKSRKLVQDGILGPQTSQALSRARAALEQAATEKLLASVRLDKFSPQDSRRVALTFDDGPDPNTTGEILRLLRQRGLKATFFVIGAKCQRYPEIVRQIAAEGHSVQNHSFWHSFSEGVEDLTATSQIIAKLTGVEPTYFRPPGGVLSKNTAEAVRKLGLKVAYWSNVGGEWTAFPGAVIKINESKDALSLLPAFLDRLVGEGFQSVTLEDN